MTESQVLRRLDAERLAVGFLTTTALEAGLVKATFSSHDRLKAACEAVVKESEWRTKVQGGKDTMTSKIVPQVEAALDSIPAVPE